MGHEMTATDRMYSVRKAPWHLGEGTNVLMLDTAPETRMDRMVASGQDWVVEKDGIYRRIERYGQPTFPKLEEWNALYRSDTGETLHVAKKSYEVIQNVVGHEIFEALSEGAVLEDGTGGTIKGGAICYLSARLDEPALVYGDNSPTFPYVVVTWAHDGSGALQARRTRVRVVCWNTVSASEMDAKKAGRNFVFRHTKNVSERIEDAKLVIAGAREETAAYVEMANELARISVSDEIREAFVTSFIREPAAHLVTSERVKNNIARDRMKVRRIFDSETIPEFHRNTAYGLFQAGIEYFDHMRGYRNKETYLGRTLLRDEPYKKALVPLIRELVA